MKHAIAGVTGLQLLLIGLKLAGVIGWSWWWVVAPLWAPVAIVIVVIGGIWAWMAGEHWMAMRTLRRKGGAE